MNKSLQDQLLKAGLVDNKKAKQIEKENRKTKKQQNKSKDKALNDSQLAARQNLREKQKRDQELNLQRQRDADKKAIAAQVIQMIEHYKLAQKGGDIEYKFTDDNKIKKMFVTQNAYDEIIRGRLCIARSGTRYELVPKPIAEKIQERDQQTILVSNQSPQKETDSKDDKGVQSDDDYYAQFEIPDDLMW